MSDSDRNSREVIRVCVAVSSAIPINVSIKSAVLGLLQLANEILSTGDIPGKVEEPATPAVDVDPLYDEAVKLVTRWGSVSVARLQRNMHIGYTRSTRIVEAMADNGFVDAEPIDQMGTRNIKEPRQ